MSLLDIVKAVFPLILLLGFLFGILILVKKYSFALSGKKAKMFNVDVLYNHIILPKKYLSFVKLNDKVLVLGVSENNITLLKELDYTELDHADEVTIANKPNFVDLLKQNMGIR